MRHTPPTTETNWLISVVLMQAIAMPGWSTEVGVINSALGAKSKSVERLQVPIRMVAYLFK